MTIEEINALAVEDVRDILRSRLSLTEDQEASLEQLEAELVLYKAELTTLEDERLRRKDIEDRYAALADPNYAHAVLRPEIPNGKKFYVDYILNNPDHVAAEAFLVELEAKDAELQAVIAADEAAKQAKKDLIKDKNASTKDRLDALVEYLGLDI